MESKKICGTDGISLFLEDPRRRVCLAFSRDSYDIGGNPDSGKGGQGCIVQLFSRSLDDSLDAIQLDRVKVSRHQFGSRRDLDSVPSAISVVPEAILLFQKTRQCGFFRHLVINEGAFRQAFAFRHMVFSTMVLNVISLGSDGCVIHYPPIPSSVPGIRPVFSCDGSF
jgi:hypothetical protein